MRQIWRVALGIINAWDLWTTVVAAIGPPGGIIVFFISRGVPLEGILLAALAGIAFAVVIFVELRPFLEQLRRSPFSVVVAGQDSWPDAQRTCADCLGHKHFRLGVWNRSHKTINDVHVYLESLRDAGFRTGRRELTWLGEPFGEGKTLHPSSPEGHAQVKLVETPEGGSRGLSIQAGAILARDSEYPITIKIEGRDVKPLRVHLFMTLAKFPPVSAMPRSGSQDGDSEVTQDPG